MPLDHENVVMREDHDIDKHTDIEQNMSLYKKRLSYFKCPFMYIDILLQLPCIVDGMTSWYASSTCIRKTDGKVGPPTSRR